MEERNFRKKVGWFQFICCLLVIWNHAGNAELFLGESAAGHPLWAFQNGAALEIARASIPCFLMLSAYLFYRNFSWQDLVGKWKRRVTSLLVPYLVWNLLYYFGYLFASYIPYLSDIVNRKQVSFSVTGLIRAAILYEANPVFWFMFQLLLLTVLAPVLYLAVEHVVTGILWLGLLVWGIVSGVQLPWLNLDALTYYSAAAFAALHCRKFAECRWDRYRGILGAELVILGAVYAAEYYLYARVPAIVFSRCLVPVGMWLLADERLFAERRPFMECTFFIYAFHFLPVRLISKLAAKAFPGNVILAAALFLAMPAVGCAVSWQAAKLLKRFAAPVWYVLNGGRGAARPEGGTSVQLPEQAPKQRAERIPEQTSEQRAAQLPEQAPEQTSQRIP